VPISIDTRKPEVAREALGAGAAVVNHIEAAQSGNRMWEVVAEAGAGYLAMHMQGDPATMQDNPRYQDVVEEVDLFFESCLVALEAAGIRRHQVALDPGIGFGKTTRQNLRLLACLGRYTKHCRPVVVGVSRKSFLGRVAGGGPLERISAGLAASLWGEQQGQCGLRPLNLLDGARETYSLQRRNHRHSSVAGHRSGQPQFQRDFCFLTPSRDYSYVFCSALSSAKAGYSSSDDASMDCFKLKSSDSIVG
jgi:hypothetical protein